MEKLQKQPRGNIPSLALRITVALLAVLVIVHIGATVALYKYMQLEFNSVRYAIDEEVHWLDTRIEHLEHQVTYLYERLDLAAPGQEPGSPPTITTPPSASTRDSTEEMTR